jgi:hypothetical protein
MSKAAFKKKIKKKKKKEKKKKKKNTISPKLDLCLRNKLMKCYTMNRNTNGAEI